MAARMGGARAAAIAHRRSASSGHGGHGTPRKTVSHSSAGYSSQRTPAAHSSKGTRNGSPISDRAVSAGFTEFEPPATASAKALATRIKGAETALAAVAGQNAMGPSDYPGFLALFGFEATSDQEWAARHLERIKVEEQPLIEINVSGHEEAENHTWYKLECALWRPAVHFGRAEWAVYRRLNHLRDGIHDILKAHVSSELYNEVFDTAHFAMRGGIPGTTVRLRGWFQAFVRAVNSGTLPPSVVACALRVLDGPFKDPAIVSMVRSCSMEVQDPDSISMPSNEASASNETASQALAKVAASSPITKPTSPTPAMSLAAPPTVSPASVINQTLAQVSADKSGPPAVASSRRKVPASSAASPATIAKEAIASVDKLRQVASSSSVSPAKPSMTAAQGGQLGQSVKEWKFEEPDDETDEESDDEGSVDDIELTI